MKEPVSAQCCSIAYLDLEVLAQVNRLISSQEQQLYNHLLQCVEVETPQQLIERFRCLFIHGRGYPDAAIQKVVEQLATSEAEQNFPFILNRCCYICINRWQWQPRTQAAIAELVALFDIPVKQVYCRIAKRLQELVQGFVQTDLYAALQLLARVMQKPPEPNTHVGDAPLKDLIHRYPYLYDHCLLTSGSAGEQQQLIRQLRTQRQRQFDLDLSKYITGQIRQSQSVARFNNPADGILVTPASNPTLLSNLELNAALKQFVGGTYRNAAQQFTTYSRTAHSYHEFKDDFYEYLTAAIDHRYGKRYFNDQLYAQLQNILPDHDTRALNHSLIISTCRKLLNFLVVNNSDQAQHFVLVDLMNNMGVTSTIGLLLKIVLFCGGAKSYLEKLFAILFQHYQKHTTDGVDWLVKALENLNVAFSTHFGGASWSD
ncbi:MAG TPA: hypothetical protein V6D16_13915 [Candidatus Obscuribacterales bacterium]